MDSAINFSGSADLHTSIHPPLSVQSLSDQRKKKKERKTRIVSTKVQLTTDKTMAPIKVAAKTFQRMIIFICSRLVACHQF